MSYSERLHNVIPGGCHTYSRGDDQFPENSPQLLIRGKGAHVWDPDGQRFLDFGMGLRSVTVGYGNEEVNAAAIEAINFGNNLTRASMIELEAAEKFCSLIDSVDMVKFCKNGSNAVTAAIKLARAFTGKSQILKCSQHPFFSFDDWFIATTPMSKGCEENAASDILEFNYSSLSDIDKLLSKNPNNIAALIMEPMIDICPQNGSKNCCGKLHCAKRQNLLTDIQYLCHRYGVLFILDETITGFRYHQKGAQYLFGVKPDLSIFGKGMANGFSVACVSGSREVMELGGIRKKGLERLFLLSSTHGAEMSSLAAFIATQKILERDDVCANLWDTGLKLKYIFNKYASNFGLNSQIYMEGPDCSPIIRFIDQDGMFSPELRTTFNHHAIAEGLMIPWISICHEHGSLIDEYEDKISRIFNRLQKTALKIVQKEVLLPVFRKYN
jgi:glutamate-1-semialdehyde 2,1-aminomutase